MESAVPCNPTPLAPFWENSETTYHSLPSFRHRVRFFISALKRFPIPDPSRLRILDYGCGNGAVLEEIKKHFLFSEKNMFGCDVDPKALDLARQKLPGANFQLGTRASGARDIDVVLCGEVLEHTTSYADVIDYLKDILREGGLCLLTTQSGRIHASDRYFGHTQHFDRAVLIELLRRSGFKIVLARSWGFPFFWMQKISSNWGFQSMKHGFLEPAPGRFQRMVFAAAYYLYLVHDLILFGPQLYIRAEKLP